MRGAFVFAMLLLPSTAFAWEPFRSPNSHVEAGNAAMATGDAPGAQREYDLAARELPNEPGVHLDRGIALMAQGQGDEARQAFLTASEPPSPDAIRADAYYNLGLTFYLAADSLAQQEDKHREAQQFFREAVDGFRRSLRARPGNRDAAWNLELALRRLHEEEEAQRQQEQQNQQNQQQNQNQQGQNDPNQQNQQNQDGQDGGTPQGSDGGQQGSPDAGQDGSPNNGGEEDGGSPDQQGSDAGTPENGQPDAGQNGQPNPGDEENGSSDPGAQNPGQNGQNPQNQPPSDPRELESGGAELPSDVRRVLDALQNSEENLERYRARSRAQRDRRAPTMDW